MSSTDAEKPVPLLASALERGCPVLTEMIWIPGGGPCGRGRGLESRGRADRAERNKTRQGKEGGLCVLQDSAREYTE
eukprot:1928627-Rhodomonas_salina.1